MRKKTGYSAEDIFEAFLYEQVQRGNVEWRIFDRRIHRAFYQVAKELPDAMTSYDRWLIRSEPCSPRLTQVFWEFRQSRKLVASDDGKVVLKDVSELQRPGEGLERIAKHICDKL